MSDIKCALLKPFGSTILKSELPDDLVKEFLNYLSIENQELAKKQEKEYHFKVRMFERII